MPKFKIKKIVETVIYAEIEASNSTEAERKFINSRGNFNVKQSQEAHTIVEKYEFEPLQKQNPVSKQKVIRHGGSKGKKFRKRGMKYEQ